MMNPWKTLLAPICILVFGFFLLQQTHTFLFNVPKGEDSKILEKYSEKLLIKPDTENLLRQVTNKIEENAYNFNLFKSLEHISDLSHDLRVFLIFLIFGLGLTIMVKPTKFILNRWKRILIMVTAGVIFILFAKMMEDYTSASSYLHLKPEAAEYLKDSKKYLRLKLQVCMLFFSSLLAFVVYLELRNQKSQIKYLFPVCVFVVTYVFQNSILALIFTPMSEVYIDQNYRNVISPELIPRVWWSWAVAGLLLIVAWMLRNVTYFIVCNKSKIYLTGILSVSLVTWIAGYLLVSNSNNNINELVSSDLERKIFAEKLAKESQLIKEKILITKPRNKSEKAEIIIDGKCYMGGLVNVHCSLLDTATGKDYLRSSATSWNHEFRMYLLSEGKINEAFQFGEARYKDYLNKSLLLDYPRSGIGEALDTWLMVIKDPRWTQEKQDFLFNEYAQSLGVKTNPTLLERYGIKDGKKKQAKLTTVKGRINYNGKPYSGDFYLQTSFEPVLVKNGILEVANVMFGEYRSIGIDISKYSTERSKFKVKNWPEKIVVDESTEVIDIGTIEIFLET